MKKNFEFMGIFLCFFGYLSITGCETPYTTPPLKVQIEKQKLSTTGSSYSQDKPFCDLKRSKTRKLQPKPFIYKNKDAILKDNKDAWRVKQSIVKTRLTRSQKEITAYAHIANKQKRRTLTASSRLILEKCYNDYFKEIERLKIIYKNDRKLWIKSAINAKNKICGSLKLEYQ